MTTMSTRLVDENDFDKKHKIKIKIQEKVIWNQNQNHHSTSDLKSKSYSHQSDLKSRFKIKWFQISPHTDPKG